MKNLLAKFLALSAVVSFILSACSGTKVATLVTPAQITPQPTGDKTMYFGAGSESEQFMLKVSQPWFADTDWEAPFAKIGSVDQKVLLQSGKVVDKNGQAYNVILPASQIWASLGDTHKLLVDNTQPAFYTPMVVAGRKSIMDGLKWTGKAISVSDFVKAVENGTKAQTSNPMRSNSGAIAFIGIFNQFAGNDSTTPLSQEQVSDQALIEQVRKFYELVKHDSPSTGTMTNSCVADPDCEVMVTYESLVIEYNLAHSGEEPLAVAYLDDAFMYSDGTPRFVKQDLPGEEAKLTKFNEFLSYLQTDEARNKMIALGLRPGQGGLRLDQKDATIRRIFNPDWGILPTIKLQPITLPDGPVLEALFYTYQTEVRQPSDIVICADVSGSMTQNGGWEQLLEAFNIVFHKDTATANQLLAHPKDLTTVLLFTDHVVYTSETVAGGDYDKLAKIYDDTLMIQHGGTNMYACLEQALDIFAKHGVEPGRQRFLLAMTDGQSDGSVNGFRDRLSDFPDMRVVAVGFSDGADVNQLHSVVDPAGGKLILIGVSDGKENTIKAADLVEAMKSAVGSK